MLRTDSAPHEKGYVILPQQKKNLSGMWSRRIDETNRIVYYEKYGGIIIVACRGHYDS